MAIPREALLYWLVQVPTATKAEGVHQARLIVHQDCNLLQGFYRLKRPQVEEIQVNLEFERCKKCHQAARRMCDTQINDVQVGRAII